MRCVWLAILLVGQLAGCEPGVAEIAPAGRVSDHLGPQGPAVVYEPLREAGPEIPFPNDLMLIPSDETLTGHRWNVTTEAPTAIERRFRRLLNTLDGFGPFAPISVSFEGPLDLTTLSERAVLVVNIEAGHPGEGRVSMMDLGQGYYPVETTSVRGYWGHDPRAHLPDFLFGEDNVADLDGDGVSERVTFYDVATNTLILRTVMPLDQGAKYAVLVMRELRGWAPGATGESLPVTSPFALKAHAAQAVDVARGLELVGQGSADLAFGWTFTTSRMADALLVTRDGLHGTGPLKRLGEEFPPVFSEIRALEDLQEITLLGGANEPVDPQDHPFTLQPKILSEIMNMLNGLLPMISGGLDQVDYVVFGSFETPDVRTGEHLSFGLNPKTGAGETHVSTVPFVLSVPKATDKHTAPFPVAIYFHGTNSSRIELLAIMNSLARQGIAGLSIDEVGHGPIVSNLQLLLAQNDLSPDLVSLILPVLVDALAPHLSAEFEDLETEEALRKLKEIPLFAEFGVLGRAEDENGDGVATSGESFFSADPFRLCGSFQQDTVDFFQLVRILRSFNQANVPEAVSDPRNAPKSRLMQNLMAGDFNADGVLDIGGPDVQLGTAGTSLGGFHAVLGAALDPEVTVTTPIVAGAGFGDLMLRTKLSMVAGPIYHEIFGPLVVGCADGKGGVHLSFNDDADRCKEPAITLKSFAHLPGVDLTRKVRVTNLSNGEVREAAFDESAGFSVGVEADAWDDFLVEVDALDGEGFSVHVQTPYSGSGFVRNTPHFRRFWNISQQVLDRCDPASFSEHLFLNPLPGHPPVNVLLENALGDATVPISTGITLARLSGALGTERAQWEPIMKELISLGVVQGNDLYDVDDALGDNPVDQPALGPFEPVPTGAGVATIRFADVHGKHEWIAAIDPGAELDRAMYSQSRISLFHRHGGAWVADDVCIANWKPPCLDDSP